MEDMFFAQKPDPQRHYHLVAGRCACEGSLGGRAQANAKTIKENASPPAASPTSKGHCTLGCLFWCCCHSHSTPTYVLTYVLELLFDLRNPLLTYLLAYSLT